MLDACLPDFGLLSGTVNAYAFKAYSSRTAKDSKYAASKNLFSININCYLKSK